VTDEWAERDPEPLNTTAVVGLVVSVIVAVAGLFALPTLLGGGLSFGIAFWFLCGVEFVAAIGVIVSVTNLRSGLT
jgi:hypothetical protein